MAMMAKVATAMSVLALASCASSTPHAETDYWTGVISFSGSEFSLRNARHHENGEVSEVYPRCLGGSFPRALFGRARAEYDGKSVVIAANVLDWPPNAAFVRITAQGLRITNHECASPFVLIGRKVWLEDGP